MIVMSQSTLSLQPQLQSVNKAWCKIDISWFANCNVFLIMEELDSCRTRLLDKCLVCFLSVASDCPPPCTTPHVAPVGASRIDSCSGFWLNYPTVIIKLIVPCCRYRISAHIPAYAAMAGTRQSFAMPIFLNESVSCLLTCHWES